MARRSLKNTVVRIEDGFSAVGRGNGTTNTTGVANVQIEAITVTLEVGQSIVFTGHATEYSISAVSPSTGATTMVTLAPVLTSNVANDESFTVGPHYIEIKIGDGNFTYSEKRTMEYGLDRGNLDTVREGDDIPIDVSFDGNYEYITGSGNVPTLEDALKKAGEASDWVTSDSDDSCAPYANTLRLIYDPGCGESGTEETVLRKFRWEEINHDISAGQLNITGKCNVKVGESTRGS